MLCVVFMNEMKYFIEWYWNFEIFLLCVKKYENFVKNVIFVVVSFLFGEEFKM